VPEEGGLEILRKHGDSALPALAVVNDDLSVLEVEVLDPDAQAFVQPKSGAIEKERHEAGRPMEVLEHPSDFVASEHHRYPTRPLGADAVELSEILVENVAIEEEQGAQGLVLGRCADLAPDGEVGGMSCGPSV